MLSREDPAGRRPTVDDRSTHRGRDAGGHGTALTRRALPTGVRWHRPLLWLAAAMSLLALVALVARFVDPREVTGLNPWDKPLKFALSTVIYSVTWSWLIGQLQRGRRSASVMGTVIAVALLVELVIITGAGVSGATSHFNVTTPVNTALWATMAASISILWVATFVVAVILFRNSLGDSARTTAIRLGAIVSVVGLALGYLMTSPTSEQLDDFQGIAGAHTVGLADGGPGLPVLGWSTVAGDLRIPHFVGMHALQAIPLLLIAIELLSRRVGVLRDVVVRTRLVVVSALGYTAFVALVTWQALRGQSIVQPDAVTMLSGTAMAIAVLVAAAMVVRGGTRSSRDGTESAASRVPSTREAEFRPGRGAVQAERGPSRP